MGDAKSFAAFASSGYFSGDNASSLTNDTNIIGLGLRTYIVSTALSQNNYEGMYFNDSANTGSLSSGTIADYCGANPFACYQNGSDYFRLGLQGKRGDESTKMMQTIVQQNNWTTADLLFGGAFKCAASGNFGNSVINYNPDGSLDLSCMSQMKECSTDEGPHPTQTTNCPVNLVNGGCPISWCVSKAGVSAS